MTCEECGRRLAFMHSKTGRFLCRSCIHKDGPGQLQESDLFENPSRSTPENLGEFQFITPDLEMKSDE